MFNAKGSAYLGSLNISRTKEKLIWQTTKIAAKTAFWFNYLDDAVVHGLGYDTEGPPHDTSLDTAEETRCLAWVGLEETAAVVPDVQGWWSSGQETE